MFEFSPRVWFIRHVLLGTPGRQELYDFVIHQWFRWGRRNGLYSDFETGAAEYAVVGLADATGLQSSAILLSNGWNR